MMILFRRSKGLIVYPYQHTIPGVPPVPLAAISLPQIWIAL
jgi:hypothetical protein